VPSSADSRGRVAAFCRGGCGNCPNILIGGSRVSTRNMCRCCRSAALIWPRRRARGQTSVPGRSSRDRRLPHQPVLRDVRVLPTPLPQRPAPVAGVAGRQAAFDVHRAPHPREVPAVPGSAAISPFAPARSQITSTASATSTPSTSSPTATTATRRWQHPGETSLFRHARPGHRLSSPSPALSPWR